MRRWAFLLLFFSCNKLSFAQSFPGSANDNLSVYIPAAQATSTSVIADYINKNYKRDFEKVRAIYGWVTTNLTYDIDSANVINLGLDPDAKVTAALRRRRGVCENFAAVFNDICLKSGLKSFVVDGYTKQNGNLDKTGHAWCAVCIDNNWLLCDPTWDVGGNIQYFLVQPTEMITSHMPYDPMWQLLNYPVSHAQFNSGNFYENKQKSFFNYADTITAYIQLDSLQKFRSSAFRIEQQGLYNNMVKNRLNYNKMNIEIIRQDKDVDLYNSSVADLNEAMKIYNNFIQFRNKQFMPEIADNALQGLLSGIDAKILQANNNLDEIAKSEATFTFSTDAVREKLVSLAARVKEQKDFLSLYLNTAKANRQNLFFSKQVSTTRK